MTISAFRRATATLTAAALAVMAAATGAAASNTQYDTVQGVITPVIAETAGASDTEYVISTDSGKVVAVDVPATLGEIEPGSEIVARVIETNDDAPAEVVSAQVSAGAVAASAVPQNHRAYVVVINDSSATSVSVPLAQAMVTRATGYWVRESKGAIPSFQSMGAEVLTLPGSCSRSYTELWNLARLEWAGVDFTQPGNHLVVFSPSAGCSYPYAGIANVGNGIHNGGMTQIVSDTWSVLAHEWGHNFGLGHSNSLAESGVITEYYGFYGPQSASLTGIDTTGMLDGAYQDYLSLSNVPHQHVGTTRTTQAQYTLNAVGSTSGATALSLSGANGRKYYVEYRACTGNDVGALCSYPNAYVGSVTAKPGVVVYYLDGNDVVYLPSGTVGGLTQIAIDTPGRTLTSAAGGFSVTVDSMNGTAATVSLNGGGSAPVVGAIATTTTITAPSIVEGTSGNAVIRVLPGASATGSVDVTLDGAVLGTVALTNGAATIALPNDLPAGTHTLAARYAGVEDQFLPSSGATNFTVTPAGRDSVVNVTAASVKVGAVATADVHVSSTVGIPTGVVDVYVNDKLYDSASLNSGRASFRLGSNLAAGTHTIRAQYKGSATIDASSGTTNLTIQALPTPTVTVQAPNSSYGTPATITVSLTGANATPTGTVELYLNSKALTSATLVAGVARYQLSATQAVGTYQVTAKYAGSNAVSAATGTTTLVVSGPAASTVAAPDLTGQYGQALTLPIEVTSAVGVTGSVRVMKGNTTLGTVNLAGGKGTYKLPSATWGVGTHTLTLKYLGALEVTASQATARVTIEKIAPTVSATGTDMTVGSRGKVTVTVEGNGSFIPTGKVTVFVNGVAVSGAGTLANVGGKGVVTVTTNVLTAPGAVSVLFVPSNTSMEGGTFATGVMVPTP